MTRAAIAFLAALSLGAGVTPAASAPAIPTPELRTLPNGLQVAFVRRPGLPMVQVTMALRAGTAAERPDEAGAAQITRDLLMFGTSSRSGPALVSAVERLGTLSTALTREHVLISGTFRADDLRGGVELMSDMVLRPVLGAEAIEQLKQRHAIAYENRTAEAIADATAWAAAFLDHPYGRPQVPDAATLQQLTVERVRTFFSRCYTPRGAVILVSGDTTAEQAFAAATEWFGSWERGADPPATPVPGEGAHGVFVVDRPEGAPAEFRAVFRTPRRGDEDEAAFAIARALLATGSGSPLARIVPLAPRRFDTTLGTGGVFVVGGLTRADSVRGAAEAIAGAAREIAKATPEAVDRARTAAFHELMSAIETPAEFGTVWTEGVLEGRPAGFLASLADQIASATPEAVAAAARRWLDPARAAWVFAGPVDAMGDLGGLGKVRVLDPGAGPDLLREPTPVTPAQRAQGQRIVRQAISAHGGLARLRALRASAVEADAVLYVNGREVPGRITQVRKDPDRMIYTTSFGGIDTRQILNGSHAWAVEKRDREEVIRDLDATGLAGMHATFEGDPVRILLWAHGDGIDAIALGADTIGTRNVESVEVRDGATRAILHFETGTHRLAAYDRPDEGSLGRLPRRIYDDYRKVEGVLWPHAEERLLGGEPLMKLSITKVTRADVDDIEFSKPAALEPAPRR